MTEAEFTQIKDRLYEEIRVCQRRRVEAVGTISDLERHEEHLAGRLRCLTEDYARGVEPSDFDKYGFTGA